jgi:hypothetical protein
VIASIALIVAVGGTAYATGEGRPLLGGARNPGNDTSTALTKETQIIANLSKYGTRQSNKSSSGGGAIYGCRSGAGGTAANNEPCIRANNLSTGFAFEFVATGGDTAGLIQTKDASGKPFTTNATGVATGLNADRVDSLDAEQIVTNARAGYTPLKSLAFSSATASNADEAAARAAATEVALLQFGPFTIYGKCFVDTDAGPAATPQVQAETFVRTTQDGALFDGQTPPVVLDGDPAYLNTGTAELDRTIEDASANTNPNNRATFEGDDDESTLVAPDNQAFEFRMIVGAKTGALPAGNGIWGDGDRCAFGFSRFGAS